MSSKIMLHMVDKLVENKIDLMVWSNNKDLVAVSNIKGEVSLYRLHLTKLWLLEPWPKNITVEGMAWRPDDKIIAIAYSNNEVHFIYVADKTVLCSQRFAHKITFINWTKDSNVLQEKDKKSLNPVLENASTFLPKFRSIIVESEIVNKYKKENMEDAMRIRDQRRLNFLLIGTVACQLHFILFGLYSCAMIDVKSDVVGKSFTIIDADISVDLEELFIVLSCWNEEVDAEEKDLRDLSLVLMDTAVLSDNSYELFLYALKHTEIFSLLDLLSDSVNSVAEAWENVALKVENTLASYFVKFPGSSVSTDFLELLMFGIPSRSLKKFFRFHFSEVNLLELRHFIEQSCSSIQEHMVCNIHPVGQSLSFHLTELRGMTRVAENYQLLGVDQDAITESLRFVGAFLAKSMEVQCVIERLRHTYEIFFNWLLFARKRAARKKKLPEPNATESGTLTEKDISLIADFLYGFDDICNASSNSVKSRRIHLQKVGQYFIEKDLEFPNVDNPWTEFLESHSDLASHPAIIPPFKNKSLVQLHKITRETVNDIFMNVKCSVSQWFSMDKIINLYSSKQEKVSLSHLNMVDNHKYLLVFIDSTAASEGFYLVEIQTNMGSAEETSLLKYAHFYVKSSNLSVIKNAEQTSLLPMKLLAVKFYSQDIVSVLLESICESREAILMQIPLSTMLKYTAPYLQAETQGKDKILDFIPNISIEVLLEHSSMHPVDNMTVSKFAVSEKRKLALFLSENCYTLRLSEIDAELEDIDDDIQNSVSYFVKKIQIGNRLT